MSFSILIDTIQLECLTFALSPDFLPKINLSNPDQLSILLSTNEEAWHMLRDQMSLIDWELLSLNPSDEVVSFLIENPSLIYLTSSLLNPNIRLVHFIIQTRPISTFTSYQLHRLSRINDDIVVKMLLENPKWINWSGFCQNPHPQAVEVLMKLLHYNEQSEYTSCPVPFTFRLSWFMLNKNPHPDIVSFFIQHPHRMEITYFQMNTCPLAVEYVINHLISFDRIFQYNKGAIPFLLAHPEHQTHEFYLHNDDRVVSYFIENDLVKQLDINLLLKNHHPLVFDYLIKTVDPFFYYILEQHPSILQRTINPYRVKEWMDYLAIV